MPFVTVDDERINAVLARAATLGRNTERRLSGDGDDKNDDKNATRTTTKRRQNDKNDATLGIGRVGGSGGTQGEDERVRTRCELSGKKPRRHNGAIATA